MHVSTGTVQDVEGFEERGGFGERLQPHAVALTCRSGPTGLLSLRAPLPSGRLPLAAL